MLGYFPITSLRTLMKKVSNLQEQLIQVLKRIRENKNISQRQVAIKMGKQSPVVSRLESQEDSNKGSPTMRTFLDYCDALDVELVAKDKSD